MALFGGRRRGLRTGEGPEPDAAGAEALADGAHAFAALGALQGALGDASLAGGGEDGAGGEGLGVGEDVAEEETGLLLGTGVVGLGLGGEEVVGGEGRGSLPDERLAVEAVAEGGAGGGEVGLDVDEGAAGGVVGTG